jgi:hypothetical protein
MKSANGIHPPAAAIDDAMCVATLALCASASGDGAGKSAAFSLGGGRGIDVLG